MGVKGRGKYHAIKTVVDGIKFDSRKESERYTELKGLEASGVVSELALQVKYPININGIKVCTYIADFVYRMNDGKVVVEDVKGVLTPIYRLKKKLIKAVYGIDIKEYYGS